MSKSQSNLEQKEKSQREAPHSRHDILAIHSNTTDSKANGTEIQKQTCSSATNWFSQRLKSHTMPQQWC